jgi:hypothetical protein
LKYWGYEERKKDNEEWFDEECSESPEQKKATRAKRIKYEKKRKLAHTVCRKRSQQRNSRKGPKTGT